MKVLVPFMIGFIGFQILFRFVILPNGTHSNTIAPEPIEISQTDSLQNVIDSLQNELESQAQTTDSKEKKYKEIIFEYELGIDRIKNYHPRAYEDFHRILAYREDYSREAEIENKKRLNEYNR